MISCHLLLLCLPLSQNATQAAPAPAAQTAPATPAAPATPSYTVTPLPGFLWDLFAKEPVVEDPVAFAIDHTGTLFVAESFRQEKGVEDNRSSAFWLNDDLQLQTVADRVRMYQKWASKREGGMDYYRREEDRLVKLLDPNHTGLPTTKSLFSGPMNQPEDGTGAGVLCLDSWVYYTCIPTLWRFQDTAGTGVADQREKLFTGFGVRTALRGHDMHGLVLGPDGRIYWSLGDRGYDVTTKEGQHLARPFTGAVFRCEPDGRNMEIYAYSLRNPQELAFNQWGDLFTGDNNSDAGDRARIVYIMEGGETGWDMNYQTLEGANQRGPWSQEHIWWKWDAEDALRPAWTLPPIEHLTDGPSGMAFAPGLGLPAAYDNHFFLCDFLGGDEYSRVVSFAVEPAGAGYKVVDSKPFLTNVLPTDVDFGYDGKIYVSDWSNGWYSDHTGQIYRVWDPEAIKDPRIAEVGSLFKQGFAAQKTEALMTLLGHADIRVRQRAHLELAARAQLSDGDSVTRQLAALAQDAGKPLQPRFHALWALGVAARHAHEAQKGSAPQDAPIVALLASPDAELRRLAARLAGDARISAAAPALINQLTDDDLRVRAQAAMALGKLQHADAIPNLAAVIWENDNQDPFLRHAAVMGLAGMNVPDKIHELAADQYPQNRLAAVLVMRRMNDPQLARLLHDPDLRVATEAARAVNDLPILEAQPALAALAANYAPTAAALAAAAARPSSQWTRELWTDQKGFDAKTLQTAAVFNTPPARTETAEEAVGYSKAGNNYVQRLGGFYTAPVDGEYRFMVASDDDSVLLLATDGNRASATPVAHVENYTNPNTWDQQPGQRSQPVALKAGQRCWVEARAVQQGGGNHLSVGVALPDGSLEAPIGTFSGDAALTPLLRRVVNANVREGTPANAAALADLARNPALAPAVRAEAMAALAEFMQPGPRDRVNGHWRLVDASTRDRAAYVEVLKQKLPSLAANGPSDVRAIARELAGRFSVPMDSGAALATVLDATKPSAERVACLVQLAQDKDSRARQAMDAALASDDANLRAQARTLLAQADPAAGVPLLLAALQGGSVAEQQAAVAALATVDAAAARAALAAQLAKLQDGSLAPALQVDVYEAAQAVPELKPKAEAWRAALPKDKPVSAWLFCLEGGDPQAGRQVVNFHSAAACLRCHTVEGTGGHAAPPLAGVATRHDRTGLLTSLIDPNAQVAQGFGPVSAMPAMGTMLTPRQIRDVVAYLSTLK